MSNSEIQARNCLLAESADKAINYSQLEVSLWRSYRSINLHLLILQAEGNNSLTFQLTQQSQATHELSDFHPSWRKKKKKDSKNTMAISYNIWFQSLPQSKLTSLLDSIQFNRADMFGVSSVLSTKFNI